MREKRGCTERRGGGGGGRKTEARLSDKPCPCPRPGGSRSLPCSCLYPAFDNVPSEPNLTISHRSPFRPFPFGGQIDRFQSEPILTISHRSPFRPFPFGAHFDHFPSEPILTISHRSRSALPPPPPPLPGHLQCPFLLPSPSPGDPRAASRHAASDTNLTISTKVDLTNSRGPI